jgi:hypothetical protein
VKPKPENLKQENYSMTKSRRPLIKHRKSSEGNSDRSDYFVSKERADIATLGVGELQDHNCIMQQSIGLLTQKKPEDFVLCNNVQSVRHIK